MSPFGEIGIESELAELRQQSIPQEWLRFPKATTT